MVKVDVLQDKARQLGMTSQDIANALNSIVGGTAITQIRDDIYLVDVIGRAGSGERGSIETLQNLQLSGERTVKPCRWRQLRPSAMSWSSR